MFGLGNISIEDALSMLKPMFKKEGLKSIVIHFDEKENLLVKKMSSDIFSEFKELIENCPEAHAYLKAKQNG